MATLQAQDLTSHLSISYLRGTPYEEIVMLSDALTWFNNMQLKPEVAHGCPAKLGFTAELSLEEYFKNQT